MEDSILNTIKPLLGVDVEYEAFDAEIIAGINSALMAIAQVGVGTPGFCITGATETWGQFLEGRTDLKAVVTYVQLKTKLIFDPPEASSATTAITDILKEYEWRLHEQAKE